MKHILLRGKRGEGKYAIVDDDIYEEIKSFLWNVDPKGYVRRTVKGKGEYLHHLVKQVVKGKVIDHINRNKLDNRRENLRTCSQRQNSMNRPMQKNNRSGYKGVSFKCGRWKAQIKIGEKFVHIGYFATALEASKKYNEIAINNYGQYAYTNS